MKSVKVSAPKRYGLAVSGIDISSARLVPGIGTDGWLARLPGAVVWIPGSGHDAEELISACLSASSPTELLGRVGSRLADPEAAPWPPFAIAASRGSELVAVVHGPVELVEDDDGEERRLFGGEDVGSWLNRLLRGARSLRAGQAGDNEGLADLREGIIRASGFLLVPSDRPAGARASTRKPAQADAAESVAAQAAVVPGAALASGAAASQAAGSQAVASQGSGARQAAQAAQRQTQVPREVLLDADSPTVIDQAFSDTDVTIADQEGSDSAILAGRETLGVAAGREVIASQVGAGSVRGVYCPRDHLNDPRDEFCRTCGLPLVPGAPEVEGLRPPLGKLTWDNGEVNELVGAALVGRDVGLDGAVVSGELAALVPSGQNDSMSRVHAELRPSGWDVIVIDRGSTNGTFIWDEASKAWQRLLPDEPHVVRPGAVLAFGERTATFETAAVPAS
jgi:FHA domain